VIGKINMKKQLSYNLRIATLVMGITLSATVNAQNLLCVILDGDQTNDAIAILQVSKLGIARGALCYLDLTTTTTLENCHAVTGTVTGVTKIKIGLHGADLGDDGQVTTNSGAFTYSPMAIDQGKGSVIASAHAGGALTDIVVAAVQGKATPVLCKAKKARGTQKYAPATLSIPASSAYGASEFPFSIDDNPDLNVLPIERQFGR
jgi:isocitrate dehydrogenase